MHANAKKENKNTKKYETNIQKYVFNSNLATISCKAVALHSSTPHPALLPRSESSVEVLFSQWIQYYQWRMLELFHRVKEMSPQLGVDFGEEEEVAGGQIWWVLWVKNEICVGVAEIMALFQCVVGGCVVVMEQPVAFLPQFRSFGLDVLPETRHNAEVERSINRLTVGNNFPMHHPVNVKEDDELDLELAPCRIHPPCFSRLAAVHPAFIASYDPGHERWVISRLLTEILAGS